MAVVAQTAILRKHGSNISATIPLLRTNVLRSYDLHRLTASHHSDVNQLISRAAEPKS